jgi:hypothetical protein
VLRSMQMMHRYIVDASLFWEKWCWKARNLSPTRSAALAAMSITVLILM